MRIIILPGDQVPGITAANTYLVCADNSPACAVIDPSNTAESLAALQKQGLSCSHILLTHGHYDHILGAAQLAAATGAAVLVHEADADMLNSNRKSLSFLWGRQLKTVTPTRLLQDGDEVAAGGLVFSVLHTPGHTPGCVIFKVQGESAAFSGDTIFFEDVGATHFPGSSFDAMQASFAKAARLLPPTCVLYPGHGSTTTMGHEIESGPLAAKRRR